MGLPEVIINFNSKASNVIERSGRGIVALVIQDSTKQIESASYKGLEEVNKEDYTAENYDYISMIFKGAPNKVIVERASEVTDYTEVLQRLKSKRFNYLTIPKIVEGQAEAIVSWIKNCRNNDKKTFKAVLPNVAADYEGVINFSTDKVKVGSKVYSTAEYCPRIAGILAGLSLSRSATYLVLSEVEAIEENENPNDAVDEGKLILISDGEKIKIARGVNSLVTLTDDKSEDFKKIKIVEAMDLVKDDIRETFEDSYVGQVINDYDNKSLFLAAINSYFKELEGDNILDSNSENKADINVSAQKKYLIEKQVDVTNLNDQQVKEYNTGSKVFVTSSVKFVDAMEDLYFDINM